METNPTLIQRIQSGDDGWSWEEFIERYRPYIFKIFIRLGVKSSVAEDLTQDVLLKIWKSIKDFEYRPEQCRFRSWLSVVCRNTAYHYFSKHKNSKPTVSLEELVDASIEDKKSDQVNSIIEEEWRVYAAKRAWENISTQFNDTIRQVYEYCLKGMSAKEAAEKLSLSENTVYVYRKRVQVALAKQIKMIERELD